MARLLRIHFASVGHADARLAPLTLDLRARDGTGTGTDSLLWLRNGGGKSSILNLFYSVFRPGRREFLGSSAEGKARDLDDYVKADDLAFVVTEWDVDPAADTLLFAQAPVRRRIVGQVLAWRDRQKSSDSSRLRRRHFSLAAGPGLGFDDLPIDGLGPEPERSFEAFREWLDRLKQERPELEAFHDEAPQRWHEHLEKIGLDPELFRYQLRMNAREGSADEAFRFRTTDEFLRFYLEVAFNSDEADRVSANVSGFAAKLARRPALLGEQAFLVEARGHLQPLYAAVQHALVAEQQRLDAHRLAAAIGRSLAERAVTEQATATAEGQAAQAATQAVNDASNDAARLGRWAIGLERRAVELDFHEAEAAHAHALQARAVADEGMRVAAAAVARDVRHQVETNRNAKAEALLVAEAEQAPLRRHVARAGTNLRCRLQREVVVRQAAAADAQTRRHGAHEEKKAAELARARGVGELARCEAACDAIDGWLQEREREREVLRMAGSIQLREDPHGAHRRWQEAAVAAQAEVSRLGQERDVARDRGQSATADANALAVNLERLRAEIQTKTSAVQTAHQERERLRELTLVRELEQSDAADLDSVGLEDRLLTAADAAQRHSLEVAVEGAEDERAWRSLDQTGRLPPAVDTVVVVKRLIEAGISAWSGTDYLVENVHGRRAEMIASDPALWHGVVVADELALSKARHLLDGFVPRMPVTIAPACLDEPAPVENRWVLPGHPAHWDDHAGAALRDKLVEIRQRRVRKRDDAVKRERLCRDAALAIGQWRMQWGDGRLTVAEADLDQRRRAFEAMTSAREAASERARSANDAERVATEAREVALATVADSDRRAQAVAQYIDRYEVLVADKRAERDRQQSMATAIQDELNRLIDHSAKAEAAHLLAHDELGQIQRETEGLLEERDGIEWADDDPPQEMDLMQARADWLALRRQWDKAVSENQLRWELDRLEEDLAKARALERAWTTGREQAVALVPNGDGKRFESLASSESKAALEREIAARQIKEAAKRALDDLAKKRRVDDDLPSGEPPPATASKARDRAEQCLAEKAAAYERRDREQAAAAQHGRRQNEAQRLAQQSEQLRKRLLDKVDPSIPPAQFESLKEDREIDALVDHQVQALRDADRALEAAQTQTNQHAEALRGVAVSQRHDGHQSRVKERLKASVADLANAAGELLDDVEKRLEVVRADLAEIDSDRRMVVAELDKVAMDGVVLLREAERASRLPAGLGAWADESFLRIRADVPHTQPERAARLEPLVDRLVAKAAIPTGRELVEAAVRELAGQRIEATLLKPDTVRRRDRLPVTEMQTFSRGQQLTAAILLYCTMARLRARGRGRSRADAGVLLLDNPVGTCSSVPLLELQREVARQMRVQLVYTTGVNDPDAVATFPNTVRLRNAHRSRRSGDQHVTAESEPNSVEAIRVVAT